MQVREARPHDLDRLAALAALLFAEHRTAGAQFAVEAGRESELRELLAALSRDPMHMLLVAEAAGGALVGFVLASRVRRAGPFVERERGEIGWLYVREEARRTGAGRELVAAALTRLAARGIARVEVQVARGNAAGRAFWDALGFAATMDVLERHL